MSSTLQTAPPGAGPRRGLPRWAWVLIGLLTVIAIVAAAIAVFASRGRQVIVLPPEPAATAVSASPSATSSPTASAPAVTIADGCLGGPTELDRAVLTAQRDAPLTTVGAASFTATLMRWVYAAPPPPYQKVTARQVFTDDVTAAARRSLTSSKDLGGSAGTLDFTNGRYYVESFTGTSAIVSWLGGASPTLNGVPQGSVDLGGTVHLRSVNGAWRYADLTSERSVEDLQRIGTPYSGGC